MTFSRRAAVLLLVAAVLVGGGAAPAVGRVDAGGAGSAGLGDRYFPKAGNGGYDVANYDLRLRYNPETDWLIATAIVEASATQKLTRFNLDLRKPIKIKSVEVNGEPATYSRSRAELQITPAAALLNGDDFDVRVSYRGNPGNQVDVTGSPFGWWTTQDGAMVVNEPDGASTWFPANDHPTDKATFDFQITVPDDSAAIANGDLLGTESAGGGWTTWRWRSDDLMATYLATATIGDFDLTETTGPGGLPILTAIDRDLGPEADDGLVHTNRQLAFFIDTFGPYPFDSYGAIVDDDEVGYALETQTRPIYSGPPGTGTVAHEMAHQWFGDSVTLGRWQDIWLNEGFAVYASWLWSEHEGGPPPAARFAEIYQTPAGDPFWDVAPGDPGVQRLFDGAVYARGAMTLQAIRETVGDQDFFTILRRWADERGDRDGTTPQFRQLAEEVSGMDLRDLFDEWLYVEAKPPGWDRADPGALPHVPLSR